MSNNHYNSVVSINNKILEYMSFTERDDVLSDFIDYLSFYTTWSHWPLLKLLNSDNWPSLYFWKLSLDCLENKIWFFKAWVSTSYMWYSIKLCQLFEVKIWNKVVLKVDIYWKGLKLLREDKDLWNSLKLFFSDYLLLWDDLTICRIDYTVDCWKINFRKSNDLRCRVSWTFYKDWEIKTRYFWKKWHDSARFIRYYDKKEEIRVKWTEMLYPEYRFLPNVMRYELQVNSKGFDDFERVIKFSDLYRLICLWFHIWNWKKSVKALKDESVLSDVLDKIQKFHSQKDFDALEKISCYLHRLWVD